MNRLSAWRHMVASVLAGLVIIGLTPAGWAVQVMKDLDKPIEVVLQTAIDGKSDQPDKPFAAIVEEPVRYQNRMIPTGTVFTGQITKVRESKRFARPGYVELQVDRARLPDGTTFDFYPEVRPHDRKLRDENVYTFRRTVIEQLPFTVASYSTSIPLKLATDLNGGVITAIAVGTRMVVGAGQAIFMDVYQDDPVPTRMAKGLWRGTGIPSAWRFVTRQREPEYAPGDEIRLSFNPDALEAFFQTTAPPYGPKTVTKPRQQQEEAVNVLAVPEPIEPVAPEPAEEGSAEVRQTPPGEPPRPLPIDPAVQPLPDSAR